MKIPAKLKVILAIFLFFVWFGFFNIWFDDATIWFLMKLALYIFIGALSLWVLSVIAREIFIKVVKIEDKEE